MEAVSLSEWLRRKREPYRLVLPCGHHDFYRKVSGPRAVRVSNPNSGRYEWVDAQGRPWEGAYTCKQCGETHDHVIDKKAEKSISDSSDESQNSDTRYTGRRIRREGDAPDLSDELVENNRQTSVRVLAKNRPTKPRSF